MWGSKALSRGTSGGLGGWSDSGTQIFQNAIIQEGSFNHIGVLGVIKGILLHQVVLKDLEVLSGLVVAGASGLRARPEGPGQESQTPREWSRLDLPTYIPS